MPKKLEPETTSSAKRHCSAVLSPDINGAQNNEHVQYDIACLRRYEDRDLLQQVADTIETNLIQLERNAAYIGLRVGVCLEIAKQLIKHGEFQGWYKAAFYAWEERQLRYYHSLGKEFLKQHKDLLPHATSNRKLLTAEDVDPEVIIPRNLETPAKEFIGDHTLADLLDEHGIKKKTPARRGNGGDHGGGKARAEKYQDPNWERNEAIIQIRAWINDFDIPLRRLRDAIIDKKKHALLPPETIQEYRAGIDAVRMECKDILDVLKKVKE